VVILWLLYHLIVYRDDLNIVYSQILK
jgi:hypothetical protein